MEVADDGLSVRASFLTPGTLMGPIGMDGKTRGGIWLWERYGSEFAYVDGKWQWFHEQVARTSLTTTTTATGPMTAI